MSAKRREREMDNEEVTEDDDTPVPFLSEDILDYVFQYLSMLSLCKSAQVCRLWYDVAQRQMSKRGFFYTAVVEPENENYHEILQAFKFRPKTSILFCASRPEVRIADNVEYARLLQFNTRFPFLNDAMLVGVERAMLDNQEIRSCEELNRRYCDDFAQNGLLGVILPDIKDLNVKFAWCASVEERSKADALRMFEELQPKEGQGDPVYLMFGRHGYSVAPQVLTMFRKKYKNSQPNIWGGAIAKFIKTNDSYPTVEEMSSCRKDIHPKFLSLHGFLGILIQKPRLNAYTTIIDWNDDFVKKLTEFKAKMRLRKRSLGMVCGPHSKFKVSIYKDIMKAIKNQFPTITFAGYFDSPQLYYYGCDNTSTDGSQELIHQNAISILLITYD